MSPGSATTRPRTATTDLPVPLRRFVLAWVVMVGGLVGFWCIRPWLGTNAFNFGQIAVLVATWKIASLLCLPRKAWARFTPLRFCTSWCNALVSRSRIRGGCAAKALARSRQLMVVTTKTSNKLIRIREFHIDYVGHAQPRCLMRTWHRNKCSTRQPEMTGPLRKPQPFGVRCDSIGCGNYSVVTT